jgi:hypothetical protein
MVARGSMNDDQNEAGPSTLRGAEEGSGHEMPGGNVRGGNKNLSGVERSHAVGCSA